MSFLLAIARVLSTSQLALKSPLKWWALGLGLSLSLLLEGSGSSSRHAFATENSASRPVADDVVQAEETQVAAAPRLRNWSDYPVELYLLDPDINPTERGVITDRSMSQHEWTAPSLWWAQDQYGGKLLEHWLAYPGSDNHPRRIDLIVDRQLWGLSTYLERYTFIHRFGTVAKSFGYSMRVFNDQGDPLATYICEFPASVDDEATSPTDTLDCDVNLDASGAGALRGRSGGFEALF